MNEDFSMTTKQDPDPIIPARLQETRITSLRDALSQARALREVALKRGDPSAAVLYGDIEERAGRLIHAEERFRAAEAEDEANREHEEKEKAYAARWQGRIALALTMAVIFAVMVFATSCQTAPADYHPGRGTNFEVSVGQTELSGRGSPDFGDVDPMPTIELSGSMGGSELFLSYAQTDQADVDAGALGLFDLEGRVLRGGVGLRFETGRFLGLDSELGLGACITVFDGTATAGPIQVEDSGGGLGAYVQGTLSRGPFFLRGRYVSGPELEVGLGDDEVELGGFSAMGGVRWNF